MRERLPRRRRRARRRPEEEEEERLMKSFSSSSGRAQEQVPPPHKGFCQCVKSAQSPPLSFGFLSSFGPDAKKRCVTNRKIQTFLEEAAKRRRHRRAFLLPAVLLVPTGGSGAGPGAACRGGDPSPDSLLFSCPVKPY